MNELLEELKSILLKRTYLKSINGEHMMGFRNQDIIRMYGIIRKLEDKNQATDFMNTL